MTRKHFLMLAGCAAAALGILPALLGGAQEPAEASERISLTLLYDDIPARDQMARIQSLQLEPWMNVDQDPESYKTGVLNIGAIIVAIDKRTGGRPPTWMMLDAEEPFFSNLQKDPTEPEFKRAQETLIAAIRALRNHYPGTKWSLYGMPNLPNWVNKRGWATISDAERKKTLDGVARAYAAIVAELDWVSVSIYDYYDPNMVVKGSPNSVFGTPESVREDGRAWRMASVGLAKLLAKRKPVIPTVFPYWAPGGIAPYCRVIEPRKFIEDQIVPAIKGGAKGFAMWANLTYRINQVTQFDKDPGVQSKERNFGVAEWRAAFTADYLGGTEPPNWRAPEVAQTLIRKTSQTILDDFGDIRSYEKLGNLPKSAAP